MRESFTSALLREPEVKAQPHYLGERDQLFVGAEREAEQRDEVSRNRAAASLDLRVLELLKSLPDFRRREKVGRRLDRLRKLLHVLEREPALHGRAVVSLQRNELVVMLLDELLERLDDVGSFGLVDRAGE